MLSRYYPNVTIISIIFCRIVNIVLIIGFVIVVNIFAIVVVFFIVAVIIVSTTSSIVNSIAHAAILVVALI